MCGARSSTAISSYGTPRAASSSTRRAISTHSRPSPGAENITTESSISPAGLLSVENKCCWRRASASTRGSTSRCSGDSVKPATAKGVQCPLVASRNSGEDGTRFAGERSEEPLIGGARQRHVEQNDHRPTHQRVALLEGQGGGFEQRGAIDRASVLRFVGNRVEQFREIGARVVQGGQLGRRHMTEAQLRHRPS